MTVEVSPWNSTTHWEYYPSIILDFALRQQHPEFEIYISLCIVDGIDTSFM